MSEENNKKGKEIDISQVDFEKLREKVAENPGILPYAHTAGGALIKPEDKGKIKGRAVTAMHQQTEKQMLQLYEQMQTLAAQASAIKTRVQVSERIYLADMPFDPIIGETYYLYQKTEEKDVLSLVAPEEWGRSKSFMKYIAKVRMLADHTWEVMHKAEDAE